MPVYDYSCEKCENNYEVSKSISSYDGLDSCPQCGNVGKRIINAATMFIGEKVQSAEWNPGLGEVVKNSSHRAEICRKKGLEEVGNESVASLESIDKDRIKRIEKSWGEV